MTRVRPQGILPRPGETMVPERRVDLALVQRIARDVE